MIKSKLLCILLMVALMSTLVFCFAGCDNYIDFKGSGKEKGSVDLTLRLDENNNFKILQLTDIQFTDYMGKNSIAVLDSVIDYADADLIVLTGDQISPEYLGGRKAKSRKIVQQITMYMDSKEVPWTLCFGNHDGAMGVLTKREMLKEYQKSAYFIGGLEESQYFESYSNFKEDTYCNYFIPIYAHEGEEVEYGVFVMDCATSLASPYDGYTIGQIAFYNEMSKKYPDVRMSMYTHEPTQEFQTMYDNRENVELVREFKGEIESPEDGKVYYPTKNPESNEMLRQSLIANNNVDGIYVGHDHLSNFAGIYKMADGCEIILGFGRMSSYGYHEWKYFMLSSSKRKLYKNYPRGGRIVEVSKDDNYVTYDVLDSKDGKRTMTTRNEIVK